MTDERTTSTAQVFRPRVTLRRPGKWVLRVVHGTLVREHRLETSELTVGRSSVADIQLNHHSVSKLHVCLKLTPTGALLRDLGSTNGTWFAGRRVEAIHLEPGDEFVLGEYLVRLESIEDVEVVALESEHFGLLRGSSSTMRELYAQLEALGPTPLDILILGETGTGKELTARTIHELSRRRGQFVVLDCAALPASLAEGILFGFRKGSFTGADHDQAGIVEEASGGTLFIDEVGELPLDLQKKLLGVLERRETTRIGEPGRVRSLDLRVVAATHRDLRQAVANGTFREDLYFRLARAVVHTPPLRQRSQDITMLARIFLQRVCQEHRLEVMLSPEAELLLERHSWPGNVRELRNIIECAAHVRRSGVIAPEDLTLGGFGFASTPSFGPVISNAMGENRSYMELHAEFDRLVLPRLLERYDHNLSQLSQHLGLSRDTVRKRLKELGLYTKK